MPRSLRLLVLLLIALAAPSTAPSYAEDESPAEQDILGLIAPRTGERIADLGCGRGRWTFALARAVGPHGRVYAVDINAEVLRDVTAKRDAEGVTNVEVIQSAADDPSLPKGTLDAVFLNDVIDYVTRDALVGFLDGVREALKEEGRLIIRDPNGSPDRVIAECYRAGFSLIEAKIPLPTAPSRSFSNDWYALKLRRSDRQHSVLPRIENPKHHRTRLLLGEELFRAGLISRDELRGIWEGVRVSTDSFDPTADEQRALVRAARAVGTLDEQRAAELLHALER